MLSSVSSSSVSPPATHAPTAGPRGASPEARLLALIVENQLVQGESAQTSVHLGEEQLKQVREDIRHALAAAREASEDAGFWGKLGDVLDGDIATLAEVVVIAAASVVSGGTAAVVLGAIAVACTLASKYADELGIPKDLAMGLAIAAAVTSVASGNIAASSQAAALAGATNGAAAVGSGAAQVSRVVQVAQEVKFWAGVVAPAATAGGAGLHLVEGYYASEAAEHGADAHGAQAKEQLTSLDIDAAVELLGRALDRQLDAMSEAGQTLEANQQSKQLIVQSFRGIA